MTSLRVAACQFTSGDDPVANLAAAREYVAQAAAAGARLVVLPEGAMACFGTDLAAVAEPLDGAYATGIREAAAEHDVTVVTGMFEPADGSRVHNTLLLTGPDGEVSYRKIHLYDAFGAKESDLVAPGSEHVTIDVHGVRVGLATCYDVRFADQFTALGRAGAQLVVLPASWGDGPGKAHQWDLLTAARAHDARAWLLACDQAWTPPKGRQALGIGRSLLADPRGLVRHQLGGETGLLVADVDTDLVADVRSQVPILG